MQGELYTEAEIRKVMYQSIEDGTFTYGGIGAKYPSLAKFIAENKITVLRHALVTLGGDIARIKYYYFWPTPEFKDNES